MLGIEAEGWSRLQDAGALDGALGGSQDGGAHEVRRPEEGGFAGCVGTEDGRGREDAAALGLYPLWVADDLVEVAGGAGAQAERLGIA